MLTRTGNQLPGYFPEIAGDLTKLPDMMIDGELVNSEGKPAFYELTGRCAIAIQSGSLAASAIPAAAFASDLLRLKGKIFERCRCLRRKPVAA